VIMGSLADQFPIDFILALGDNFYEYGIRGNENDPRFKETFDDVFTSASLQNMPFHFVAGNHDWRGNVSAEVAHSAISTRWKFPSYYYTLHFVIPVSNENNVSQNLTVDIVMVDTVLLVGLSDDNDEYYYRVCKEMGVPKEKCPLGQPIPGSIGGVFEPEWAWLEQQLASSTANYLLVCGHYPIYSIAEHGPTWSLVEKLKPLLLQYQVSAYINGHDHTFEFIQFDSKDQKEDYIAYVTVGGSHTCDSSTAHEIFVPKSALRYHGCKNGGTVRVHIDTNLEFYYYDGVSSQTIMYTSPPIKPRF